MERTRSSPAALRSPLMRHPSGAPGNMASSLWRLVGAIAVAVTFTRGACSATEAIDSASLTADQILRRVAEVYAGCRSYRDSGIVKTVFIQSWGKHTVEKAFRTAFVRPDQFRFEYYEEGEPLDRFVIWGQGEKARTWWGIEPGIQDARTVACALAAATGVSGGSARRIPGLLLTERIEAGWDISRLKNLERLDDSKLRGADCMRVRGATSSSHSDMVVLWIAKTTFLIRRIDETTQFDDFRTEDTTTYEPRIDTDIPVNLLDFGLSLPR